MDTSRISIALALAALAVAVALGVLLGLMPPDRLSIAAGRPGSAYHAVAERYQQVLARDRLTLDIRETDGSAENAALLGAGAVDAAIVQGGVRVGDGDGIEALAGLFPEAVLVFHRGALGRLTSPAAWEGLRLAAGAEGSGTRAELARLAPVTGFRAEANTLLPLGGRKAAEALLAGRADAVLFVAPLDAPYLAPLFADPGVRLAAIADPEALVRRFDHLVTRTLPAAAVDYPRRVPDRPVTLLTMPARLAARDDLHPALVDRLVEAARETHRGGGLLQPEGAYPSVEALGLPVDSYAARRIREGPSPLPDLLPWWIAAQIDRVALLLLPVVFLLLPLLRAAPGFYAWRMRARVYRHYLDLRRIDLAAAQETDPARLDALSAELDALEASIRSTRLPLAYREHAYLTRQHVELIRQTIARRRAGARS